jgi:hypothetical protein
MNDELPGAPQNHWFGPAGDPRGAGIILYSITILMYILIYYILRMNSFIKSYRIFIFLRYWFSRGH